MTLIQELQRAFAEARNANRIIVREIDDLLWGKMNAAIIVHKAEVNATHGAEAERLRKAEAAAEAALIAEQDRIAMTGEGLTYPIGTEVEEVKRWSRFRYVPTGPETRRRGAIEAVTSQTKFAANVKYRPQIGQSIVRLRKTDGTLGIQHVVQINAEMWKPI